MAAKKQWSGQIAELAPLVMATLGTHVVQLYDDDAFLVGAVARVVCDGLAANDAVVVIATGPHLAALDRAFRDLEIDVESARDSERLAMLDARDTLAAFMDGDLPDATRFAATMGTVIERAAKTTVRGHVRAFGEMVALLWSEGRRDAALAIELLWNDEIARRRNFSLLCAYPLAVFGGSDDGPRFTAMCGHHTHVAPAESYRLLDSAGARLRAIAELQQKALVLETEHARATGRGCKWSASAASGSCSRPRGSGTAKPTRSSTICATSIRTYCRSALQGSGPSCARSWSKISRAERAARLVYGVAGTSHAASSPSLSAASSVGPRPQASAVMLARCQG